jgi:hypothetical protein
VCQTLRRITLIATAALATPACAAPPPGDSSPPASAYGPLTDRPETPVPSKPTPVNQRFQTLDEYLAFLEKGAAIDKAYYRRVGPDRYVLVTTIQPPPPPQYFTREELARKFGFEE